VLSRVLAHFFEFLGPLLEVVVAVALSLVDGQALLDAVQGLLHSAVHQFKKYYCQKLIDLQKYL
jgi:hypothetical protein